MISIYSVVSVFPYKNIAFILEKSVHNEVREGSEERQQFIS